MGCSSSVQTVPQTKEKEEKAINSIDTKLLNAVIDAKKKGGKEVRSFNELMLQLPGLSKGFLKCREYFQSMDTDGKGAIPWEYFKANCKYIGLDAEKNDTLREIFQVADIDGNNIIDKNEMVIVFAILYMTQQDEGMHVHPDITQALDVVQKAFTYFDSSVDGTLERKEVFAAIDHGSEGSKKQNSEITARVFDGLDWDKSGKITFKEFLLGIERMVMEEYDEDTGATA